MLRLEGKTAIITGGAQGFGAGIVDKFVAEGARVLVADIQGDKAAAKAREVGNAATACEVDVSQSDSVAEMVKTAIDAFGHVDCLVNNAGITHLPTPMEDVDEEMFDRVLAVNVKSIYLGAKHLVPHMKKRGTGNIVNVASTAGISPRPRLNWYNASKGWVITATKAMAVELAPFGVRVNALCPVAGETPLLASFMGEDTPEMRAKFLATIPLGRFSTAEDMGNSAAFLASDEASMLTGLAMEVDGGRCI